MASRCHCDGDFHSRSLSAERSRSCSMPTVISKLISPLARTSPTPRHRSSEGLPSQSTQCHHTCCTSSQRGEVRYCSLCLRTNHPGRGLVAGWQNLDGHGLSVFTEEFASSFGLIKSLTIWVTYLNDGALRYTRYTLQIIITFTRLALYIASKSQQPPVADPPTHTGPVQFRPFISCTLPHRYFSASVPFDNFISIFVIVIFVQGATPLHCRLAILPSLVVPFIPSITISLA